MNKFNLIYTLTLDQARWDLKSLTFFGIQGIKLLFCWKHKLGKKSDVWGNIVENLHIFIGSSSKVAHGSVHDYYVIYTSPSSYWRMTAYDTIYHDKISKLHSIHCLLPGHCTMGNLSHRKVWEEVANDHEITNDAEPSIEDF